MNHGIHHITAISGDPIATVRFYGDTLGLRLVKRTVNFDDPGTWHLYFGEETGKPGSILTFFPWPNGARGRVGTGQAAVTSFAIPPSALGYWLERFASRSIAHDSLVTRFDERVIGLRDPDGMLLELVASPRVAQSDGWAALGGVPEDHAIRGFHGTTIWTAGEANATESLLTRTLGFRFSGEETSDQRRRFVSDASAGGVVDIRRADGFWRGAGGVGTVHHVAFRASDSATQLAAREQVLAAGLAVTPVVDRQYFQSIYFREPSGVLFEIATDGPGFLIDEPQTALGTELRLPAWLENEREQIARILPPLEEARVARSES